MSIFQTFLKKVSETFGLKNLNKGKVKKKEVFTFKNRGGKEKNALVSIDFVNKELVKISQFINEQKKFENRDLSVIRISNLKYKTENTVNSPIVKEHENFSDIWNNINRPKLKEGLLMKIYDNRKKVRVKKIKKRQKKVILQYLSEKDFPKAINSYNDLKYLIGRHSFKSIELELKDVQDKFEQYKSQLLKTLNELSRIKESLDPLSYLKKIKKFKVDFPSTPNEFQSEYDIVNSEYLKLEKLKFDYDSRINEIKKLLGSNKFSQVQKKLVDIKVHELNSKNFYYENEWNALNVQLEEKISSYLKLRLNEAKSIKNIHLRLKQIQDLISLYSEDTKSSSLKNAQKLLIVEGQNLQKKINKIEKDSDKLLKNVESSFNKEKYDVVISLVENNGNYLKSQRKVTIINKINEYYIQAQEEVDKRNRKQQLKTSKIIKASNLLKKDSLNDLEIQELESLFEELKKLDVATEFEKRIETGINKFNLLNKQVKVNALLQKTNIYIARKQYDESLKILREALNLKADEKEINSKISEVNELIEKKKKEEKASQRDEIIKKLNKLNPKNEIEYHQGLKFIKEFQNYGGSKSQASKLNSQLDNSYGKQLESLMNSALIQNNFDEARLLNSQCYKLKYIDYPSFNTNSVKITERKKKYDNLNKLKQTGVGATKLDLSPNISFLQVYYPKNRFHNSDLQLDQIYFRQNLWKFKDGINQNIFIDEVVNLIKENISYDENTVFCVAPASKIAKNQIRFENFCKKVARSLNIINGYDFIYPYRDREALKGASHKNVLETIEFKADKINGKKIILFDDVITDGTTFEQIKGKLISLGAKNVCGVFLGVTEGRKIHTNIN